MQIPVVIGISEIAVGGVIPLQLHHIVQILGQGRQLGVGHVFGHGVGDVVQFATTRHDRHQPRQVRNTLVQVRPKVRPKVRLKVRPRALCGLQTRYQRFVAGQCGAQTGAQDPTGIAVGARELMAQFAETGQQPMQLVHDGGRALCIRNR